MDSTIIFWVFGFCSINISKPEAFCFRLHHYPDLGFVLRDSISIRTFSFVPRDLGQGLHRPADSLPISNWTNCSQTTWLGYETDLEVVGGV